MDASKGRGPPREDGGLARSETLGRVTEACPEKSKASPEKMEALVFTFEESSE
jgi:hypothetical protein